MKATSTTQPERRQLQLLRNAKALAALPATTCRDTKAAASPPRSEFGVFLARDLIGKPDHLFYLCHNRLQNERRPSPYVWSTRGERVTFSIADAIDAAPLLKFRVKQALIVPGADNDMQPIDWSQVHHKTAGVGVRVVSVMGGADISYLEFMSIARGENLPNLWFLHYSPIHQYAI
jgi:hypothetical protein